MELDGRDWLGQARRGVIELCVLALIRSEPRYGYQLVTALAELGRPLAASEGTLYPLLRRLQREGLVDAAWQESPDGPPRKYYHLSESGARLLEAELAEWEQLTYAIAKLAPLAVTSHESRVASYTEARSVAEAELTTHDSRLTTKPETREPLAVTSHESRVASYTEARSVAEAELTTHDSRLTTKPETRDSRLRDY